MNTHAAKAKSYDIGRPEYPGVFFDFLYNETGLKKDAVIADIGCGTGKVTRNFLERGSKVIAIEPDSDMLGIVNEKLKIYPNYSSFQRTAEKRCLIMLFMKLWKNIYTVRSLFLLRHRNPTKNMSLFAVKSKNYLKNTAKAEN